MRRNIVCGGTGVLLSLLVVPGLISPIMVSAQGSTFPARELGLPGSPFAVAVTPDGSYAFASLSGAANGIAIVAQAAGAPTLLRVLSTGAPTFGLAVTLDGKYLLDTVQGTNSGVQFVDIQKAIAGDPGAILGTVWTGPSAHSIEIALSNDNQFAAVSNEGNASVSVVDVTATLASHAWASALIGNIPVDENPVGLAFSHDGKYLYVTSEIATPASPGYNPTACGTTAQGTLTIVDAPKAASNPATSVLGKINAGCSPVRVAVSSDDAVAWVTARGENVVLAYRTNLLVSSPSTSLISRTPVGVAPVGIILLNQDQFIAVANSNRFTPNGTGTVSILDYGDALAGAGAAATVANFEAGQFPRQWSSSNSSLYLTEFLSNSLALYPLSASRTTVAPSLNPSTSYQSVALTAVVASPGGPPPTGIVNFVINGTPQNPVALSNGQASFSWAFRKAGIRTVQAIYSGDSANLPSASPTLNQTVHPQPTLTTLTSSLNPGAMGQALSYTATVTPQNGGTPTGTVTFAISGNTPVSIGLVNGQAVFTWTYQRGGARTVTAAYSGDANDQPSTSNTLQQTVN
jgi:DNA-binding beta-propeller fold protein YncE